MSGKEGGGGTPLQPFQVKRLATIERECERARHASSSHCDAHEGRSFEAAHEGYEGVLGCDGLPRALRWRAQRRLLAEASQARLRLLLLLKDVQGRREG